MIKMETIESTNREYIRLHGTDTKTLKTFWLKDLGSQFKIEKTEDWDHCDGDKKSYGEMIRVKGSKPVNRRGIYFMPSHLYKYSEDKLALYLKDHKKAWLKISEIIGENFKDFATDEEVFIFPIEKFTEVAKLIPFRQKRIPNNAFIESRDRLNYVKKITHEYKKEGSNFNERELNNVNIRIDHFNGKKTYDFSLHAKKLSRLENFEKTYPK